MHLTLHLTTGCNMRCSYCYSPPRSGPAMTEAVALRALELGARSSTRSCGIVFFGGEPLLCTDLIGRIVEQAHELTGRGAVPFHFKLTTNGLLLDDAFLGLACRHDVMIAVSIDGTEAAHDRHRQLPDGGGSYRLVRRNLERLLSCKPYSTVLMVVSPDTAHCLRDSVRELLDIGCRYLVVSLDYSAAWTEDDLSTLERQYRSLAGDYVDMTRSGRKFHLSCFEVKLASHVDGVRFLQDRCELGNRQISIDPEGNIFPCVQFTRAEATSVWCIGHVDTGIDEARLAAVRARSSEDREPCSGCAVEHRCSHTCGCLNWQSTGDVNTVSPVLCRSEQMLVRIADEIGALLYRERDPHFLHKHYNPAYSLLSLLEEHAG